MRLMALDYGSKTVGVALSDPLLITAQCKETIVRKKENHLRQTLSALEKIVKEYEVSKIIVGLPLNMNDSIGERGKLAIDFANKLKDRVDVPVIMWDERLTTVEADEILNTLKVAPKDRKKYIDSVAAVLILESYMEENSGRI